MKAVFKFFIFILFFILYSAGFASATAKDSTPITVRRPSPEKIQKYLSDKKFIYENDYRHKLGLWDIIARWLDEHIFNPLFNSQSITFWNIIEYGLAIGALVFIIYYLIRSEKIGLFYRGPKNMPLDITGGEEDIHIMNFDRLIDDAVANGQYRIAIRYLYLKLLKDLSDKNLITWKAEKTNNDYINELHYSAYEKEFRAVTILFDYAWYGDMPVNENIFGQVKSSFSGFYHHLQSLN